MTATATQPWQLVTGGDPYAPYPVPAATDFINPDTRETADYLPAPDLETIGRALLLTRVAWAPLLADARIAYLWKREGGEVKGKSKYGQCQRPGALWRHLANVDAVIWLAADHLRHQSAYTVEACLYHESCHLDVEKGQIVIVDHDIAEFTAVIERYGVNWLPDRAAFARVIQAALPLGG